MNTLIITAADTKFFALVQGTILSIRENSQGKDIAIAFFDLGCTDQELEWIQSRVNIIKQPNWDFDFPSRSQTPKYLKGLLARPFLREYFPNFDVYLWIDADAWVQDWKAVDLYIQGATKRGLAIAPELDRGYSLSFGKLTWYWQFVRRDYETFFGAEVAEKFYTYPTLNAGIFALHCDAPHWQVWEHKIREALQRSAGLMSDQVALNFLVYSELFDHTELLPAWCNWSCNFGLPVWDQRRNCFVEPYLPHTPIGIFHLTGHKHERLQVATTEGNMIEVSTRYQPSPNQTTTEIPPNPNPNLSPPQLPAPPQIQLSLPTTDQHILLCTGDRGVGGVAKYNHALLCALARKGYRLTCLQPHAVDTTAVAARQQLGIKHLWFEDSQTQTGISHMLNTASERPHLIISSNTSPFSNLDIQAAAIAFAIPFVIIEGLVSTEYIKRETPQRIEQLARHYTKAKATIAVSQANLNLLHEFYGLPRDRGQVIHYGRPSQYFRPKDMQRSDRLRQSLNIPNDAVVCFTSARIETRKGYHYQLEAIRALMATPIWPQLYFVWAGGGIFRPELETQLKEALQRLGIADKVKFLGQVPDVAEWLDLADIFVLPSQDEGMPLSAIEAMAKGLPIIATAVGGIPEALGNTGRLIPDPKADARGTITELTQAIQELAMQPELRHQLAQATKQRTQNLFTENRMLEETITVIESVLLPDGDYISPGLQIIQPDRCFPNMIVGDTDGCRWRYLRRKIPHNWYVDQRYPFVGFLSRDEAHILYNTALKFKGKRALEIGCWMGWSACHIAIAGVNLEIIDPLLSQSPNQESVISSLEAAAKEFGTFEEVKLIAGYSPQKVDELANQQQRKWSLIFIDGNHDAPYPLNDAITCEKYAEPDAMILFHDLSSPDVAQGLDYLRDRGWQTMIYQTMQIMGVAWRGNVEPVQHIPDPNINWQLPQHLAHYQNNQISGGRLWSSSLPKDTLRSIQQSNFKYTYKGVLMQKNPFDFAIYHMLLWQIKPKTIIEIGSCYGGSALWMADLFHTFGIDDGHVYSIDLNRVSSVQHPNVTFLEGEQTTLDKVLSVEFLNSLHRPLLVIEDGAHHYHTTLAVLEFFHPYLRKDEYIIIEDGIISDLGEESFYQGGPNRAIREFLKKHGNEYVIDTNYCDFFGHNLTWNTNGYLKKVTDLNPATLQESDSLQDASQREFSELVSIISFYSLLSRERLFSLYTLAKQICQSDLPGNFVECGSFKGGAAAMLATVIKRYSQRPRLLYAFDTFEGMPEPSEADRHNGVAANDTGFGVGTLKAPVDENLAKICQLLGVEAIVKPVKGLFADTLPNYKVEIGDIALLHADGDWYESTMDIFRNLYDSVSPGAFVQIDDYGHWEGCRQAIHDFEKECGDSFDLQTIDYTGTWFQKNQKPQIKSRKPKPKPSGK
jgi:cephalosporin hydroxylase/glycosyltransferase involved in cell wall biosynthesis